MKTVWPVSKLLKYTVKIGSGITPLGGESNYKKSGIPLIRSQNVLINRLDLSDVAFIDELQHQNMSNSKVFPNDVLLNITGASIGRSCVVPKNLKEANVNQHVCIIRLSSDADPNYICMFLNSREGQKQIWSFQSGGSREGLNYQQIGTFSIPLPSLSEQKAIAETLTAWDEAIEKVERLVEAKEKILSIFGRDSFYTNTKTKITGWETIKLSSVLTEHNDKSTRNEKVFSVSVHKGLINQIDHLGRSFSAANTDHYNLVHFGDIVYTKSPTGDFPYGIVKQSHVTEDVIVSPLYGVYTPVNYEMGVILDFYFESPTRARNYLYPIIQKGAKNTINITNETFISAKLHLPIDPNEQKKISEFILTAKHEIKVLKQIAKKYKEQKRGLMQKLLSGEWRVKIETVKKQKEL